MIPHLGPTELIIILVIVIIIFGGGKLASLGGALGKGVKDFRKSVKDEEGDKPEDDAKPQQVASKTPESKANDE
jgi:sec-independent protein translocase protein TatA